MGRFVNRDPIGYEGSEWNLYEYSSGRAPNVSDPFGLAVVNPVPPNIPGPGETPGPGWVWRPTPIPKNPDNGTWVGPDDQSLHPDLTHDLPKGPHWGWRDPYGNKWDWFPDRGKWIADGKPKNRPFPNFPPGTFDGVVKCTLGASMAAGGAYMMRCGSCAAAGLAADDVTGIGVWDDVLLPVAGGVFVAGGCACVAGGVMDYFGY